LLPGVEQASMVQDGDRVYFHWQDNNEIASDNRFDRTLLLLYRPGNDTSTFIIYGNERWQLTDSLSIVNFKQGDICHGYIAFISPEDQQVSNTLYLGVLEVEAF
jgi:hypothetical protein